MRPLDGLQSYSVSQSIRWESNSMYCGRIAHSCGQHYCWISSTFTMPDAFRRQVGREVAHPGIANDFIEGEGAQKYYTYYQWVCFVLFFQALACHTPNVLWKLFENNLMRTLVMGLNIGVCHENEKTKKKEIILGYLMRHVKVSKFTPYEHGIPTRLNTGE
ncbi:unnamed protein product [Callosobruchus maculatus]|uniref:Innexin n=1 Tax=Callosobruchus maculatus TaxID=64391 RepID=A0A653DEU3_CALMS|nr:unnamed protein product [Callosobruchus maculatus]